MEYMSCPEAAKNSIPGVSNIGYMWLIPKDAEKPVDARRKEFKHE